MTININVDIIINDLKVSQASLVDWCFDNLMAMTWGIKSLSGQTHIYFDNSLDAEKFAEHWGDFT